MEPNIRCAYTSIVPLGELTPHPDNENAHSKQQIKALAKIIAKVGQRSPIVVSKRSGMIVKGHGRLEAMKMLGWESAGVDEQEYDSELEELNDRVADNEIARYSEFQVAKFEVNLKKLNVDLKSIDLEEFGLLKLKYTDDETPKEVSDADDKTEHMLILELQGEKELQSIYEEMLERNIKCKILE